MNDWGPIDRPDSPATTGLPDVLVLPLSQLLIATMLLHKIRRHQNAVSVFLPVNHSQILFFFHATTRQQPQVQTLAAKTAIYTLCPSFTSSLFDPDNLGSTSVQVSQLMDLRFLPASLAPKENNLIFAALSQDFVNVLKLEH